MSFKGISWAGNVYQKFETMCLEVEEAMYQDTVKYMENQVQKVGVSVKKFCSEVMDDMRPLSCVDPMSLASDDLSLIPSVYTDITKKPIPSMLDGRRYLKKNEDQVIPNITEVFSPQSPGLLIEHKSPDTCAASKKIGVQRRLIGIKRISKRNQPSKDSCKNAIVSEDRKSKVVNCDMRTSSQISSDNSGVTSSSDFDARCDPGEAVKENAPNLENPIEVPASNKSLSSESVRQDSSVAACDDSNVTASLNVMMHEPAVAFKGNTPLEDDLIESAASQKVLSAESTRRTVDVSDCICPAESTRQVEGSSDCISHPSGNNLLDGSVRPKGDNESTSSCPDSPAESTGVSVNDTSFSVVGSSSRSKVCDHEYEEKGVTVSDEEDAAGTSMKDGLSSVGSTAFNAESCKNDLTVSNKESFDIEFIDNEIGEPGLDNFFETSGMNDLGESCILVEGDELHCALQGSRKHKSYKRRIREALASKLRSKKDEQQLLSLHEQESMRVRAREEQKLSASDCVESDWELL